MKHEPFIQLFIEFAPPEFQGAIIWLPGNEQPRAPKEREVVKESIHSFT